MKHQAKLASGLAALFLAPAVLQDQELESLEGALHETVRALEVLTGIEARLDEDAGEAAHLVLSATETAHLAPAEQDHALETLRHEVSLLQMELDALENPELVAPAPLALPTPGPFTGPPSPHLVDPTPAPPSAPPGESPPRLTTGLGDDLRDLLSSGIREPEQGPVAPPQEGVVVERPPSPEGEGYSADPVGQARACFHAGRYEQGLELLTDLTEVEALYWRSRCLARLDRLDEAIDLLTRIVQLEGESYQGQRAEKDLEFLRWKQDFLRKLSAEASSDGRAGRQG